MVQTSTLGAEASAAVQLRQVSLRPDSCAPARCPKQSRRRCDQMPRKRSRAMASSTTPIIARCRIWGPPPLCSSGACYASCAPHTRVQACACCRSIVVPASDHGARRRRRRRRRRPRPQRAAAATTTMSTTLPLQLLQRCCLRRRHGSAAVQRVREARVHLCVREGRPSRQLDRARQASILPTAVPSPRRPIRGAGLPSACRQAIAAAWPHRRRGSVYTCGAWMARPPTASRRPSARPPTLRSRLVQALRAWHNRVHG